jgi:ABC-type proline/glycine betaine transport systems, ATPase components
MLEFKGVSKSFAGNMVLHLIDLKIPSGETTVLVGPSGCGKSTLLRLGIGLIRPDRGIVRLAETELTSDNVLALRRRVGYVIQEGGLFPHLTAYKNVTLMAEYLGWDGVRIAARLKELAALTRLDEEVLVRYPLELSGGQRQRVALMRALMLNPDLLLLDEPLGALDPMTRSALQGELRGIFDALGKTVVLVTHDLPEAGFFGNHIVLLREGRIVQQGSLAQLVNTPLGPFVTEFINAQRGPLDALVRPG